MRHRRTLAPATVVAVSLALSACGAFDGWFGEGEGPPLPGERISVLALETTVEADPAVAGQPVIVPPVRTNPDWRNPGGETSHVNGNLALASPFQRAWSTSIGSGTGSLAKLLTGPIVADGRVYAMDSDGRVTAIDTASGGVLWRVRVSDPEEDSTPLGGGVAFADGLVYATTAFGEVLAVDPANGGLVWRTPVAGPVRGAPTVAQGRVIAVTVDNQTEALDARTGAKVWNHTGLAETSGLLGTASPAVESGIVVTPYSSGELYALRIENGRPVWSDSVAGTLGAGTLASLPDIRAFPVIDGDLVVAVSHAGRTVGIDMRSGARVWEQQIGGTETPWVAGDTVYVISNEAEIVALTRNSGLVRWGTALPRWQDPEDKSGPILWNGPVMVGGLLLAVSSTGQGVLVAPETGEIRSQFDMPATQITPVVANGTLYLLDDGGTLTAYR